MTTALASTATAKRGWQTETGTEYTFADIAELCAFLQHEIQSSKRKYRHLAEKAGMCASTVSKMAHGETHFPRAGTVFALLQILGYEVVIRA